MSKLARRVRRWLARSEAVGTLLCRLNWHQPMVVIGDGSFRICVSCMHITDPMWDWMQDKPVRKTNS